MSDGGQNLTGVWNGQYDYAFGYEPVGFMATLIEAGAGFSGGVSETAPSRTGEPLQLFAMIDGRREGFAVSFTKTYDGSGGWEHVVEYEGTLSADGNEIEGEWRVPGTMHGRFMMIRPERNTQTADQKIEENV
ncbi:MAG: hypothetical protein FJX29_08495 [Alphaproteobacteria bacterium]|nr:hypothetical protein [Alphaproteobacteria bacterium]